MSGMTHPAMRYFYHENANQPVMAGGQPVKFEVVDRVSGKLVGAYAAEGALADALAKIVALRQGVTEISLADYELLQLKKKVAPTSNSLSSWKNSSRPVVQPGTVPSPPLAATRGAVSAGGNNPPPPPAAAEFPVATEIIKVERVAPPRPIVEGDRLVGETRKRKAA